MTRGPMSAFLTEYTSRISDDTKTKPTTTALEVTYAIVYVNMVHWFPDMNHSDAIFHDKMRHITKVLYMYRNVPLLRENVLCVLRTQCDAKTRRLFSALYEIVQEEFTLPEEDSLGGECEWDSFISSLAR